MSEVSSEAERGHGRHQSSQAEPQEQSCDVSESGSDQVLAALAALVNSIASETDASQSGMASIRLELLQREAEALAPDAGPAGAAPTEPSLASGAAESSDPEAVPDGPTAHLDPAEQRRLAMEAQRDSLAEEIGLRGALPSHNRVWSASEFAQLYRSHRQAIWRQMAAEVGPDLADDMTGETFMRAWTAQGSFDPEKGSVESWLHGIATNLVRSHWRELARYREALGRLARGSGPEAYEVMSHERERFMSTFHDRSVAETVRVVLEQLTPAQREVMTLHYIYQLTYARVAELLNMKVSTVRSHLYRARRRAAPIARQMRDQGSADAGPEDGTTDP